MRHKSWHAIASLGPAAAVLLAVPTIAAANGGDCGAMRRCHNHFTNRNASWTWTELTRAVDGCRTATIVYDATYAIPSRASPCGRS